jgi:hypothetical protein
MTNAPAASPSPSLFRARRADFWPWLGWAALSLVYAALIVPTWGNAYLDFGDGNYLYVARRVREGLTLYRDVLSPQPPLHTLLGAAALTAGETLLGRDLWGARLYCLTLHLATAALLTLFAGRLAEPFLSPRGKQVAQFAAALLYLTIPTTFWWTRGYQTHPTLAFLMLSAALLILRDRPLALASAGLLAALGLMTSMTSAPYVLFLGGWTLLRRPRRCLWFLIPCAAAAWAMGAWAESATGAYLDNVIHNQAGSFPREEITGEPLSVYILRKLFTQGAKIVSREWTYLVAGVAGLLWWLGRAIPARHPHADFLALFTLGWWGSVVFVSKGATADYIFTLGEPWVCLWGGVAAGAAAEGLSRAWPIRPKAVRMGLAILALLFAMAALQAGLFMAEVLAGRQDELDAENVERVLGVIERYTEPGDPILAPPFYAFISGRRVAGEYAEIFLWTIKYVNERRLPDYPPGEGIAKVEELASLLRAQEIPLVMLDLAQTGRLPEIREAIDAYYCPLFGEISQTLNTPLQFYVPKPEGGDSARVFVSEKGPLR